MRIFQKRDAWSIALAVSALLFFTWLAYLAWQMPPVSRADYLWEMWGIGPALHEGRWLDVVGFLFRLIAGHVIFYARLLEIINWELFDYSGTVVKIYGLVVVVACWLSMVYAVWRTLPKDGAAGITLIWGTALWSSPVFWLVLTWPESIAGYYFWWLTYFLCMPTIVARLSRLPAPRWTDWALITVLSFAVLVSMGAGWAIIPTVFAAWAAKSGHVDRIVSDSAFSRRAGIVLVVLVALVLAALAGVTWFAHLTERTFYMDDVYLSLSKATSYPHLVLRHFFSVLAAPVMVASMNVMVWVGILFFALWAYAVFRIARSGRAKENAFWIATSFYGLSGAVLNTLGRWNLVTERYGGDNLPTHYGFFALPFLLALPLLAIRAAELESAQHHGKVKIGRWSLPPTAVGLMLAALVVVVVAPAAVRYGLRHVEAQSKVYDVMTFGAQNYHPIHLARQSGDHAFYRTYVMQLIPDLKKWGKYPALSADFIDDPTAYSRAHGIELSKATTSLEVCSGQGSNVLFLGPDTRARWNFVNQPETRLVLAAGLARNPDDCDKPADTVFITGRDGKILCISRPHRAMLYDLPVPETAELQAGQDMVFNFSCPLPDDQTDLAPYSVYAFSLKSKSLYRIAVTPDAVGSISE